MKPSKCLCGNPLNVSVVAHKFLTKDLMMASNFGENIYYYCQCDQCHKRTKSYNTSSEAITVWNVINSSKEDAS